MGRSFRRAVRMLLLLCVALCLSSCAASRRDVARTTLDNGLQVVVVRSSLAPVVTTQLNYLVGANECPQDYPGMAHALEHMMFRSSPGLSADQLAALMAALGGDFNGQTRQTITQYSLTVPADQLETALHIEAVRMQGILSVPGEWDKERGAIEQEVAGDISDPLYVFYTDVLAKLFVGTPYARDALGTRPSFQATTAQMLQDFYRTWYVPNNAVLVIVGDVDPDRTIATVKGLFEKIASRSVPGRPEVHLQPLKSAHLNLETDLPYGLAVVVYRLPGYDSPQFAAGQVLGDVLNSRRGRLYALVPEGRALSVEFSGNTYLHSAFGYLAAAFPRGADGPALLATLKDIVAGYVSDGLPAELVEAAKRREVLDAEMRKGSVSGLANAWSEALAIEGRASPDDDIEAIKGVTAEDVNRVAKDFLMNENALTAILLPRASGQAVSSAESHGKESFAPQEAESVALPSWAQSAVALPPVPSRIAAPDLDEVLPNGLRLIVKREHLSRAMSLYGEVKNNADMQAPEGKEGVDDVLNELFTYGSKNLDRLAFEEALDEIGADEKAGTSFSLHVLPDQFDRGAALLAENLLNPTLSLDAFEIVRKTTADALVGEMESPAFLSKMALRAALYPAGDPHLRHATPESVSKLELKDVVSYHRAVFRPDMTTLVVIGPLAPSAVKDCVQRYFGEWKSVGVKPDVELPLVPPNKPSSAYVPDASRVQVEVTLAETLGLLRSDPAYYAFMLGQSVLSGGFYATRLYHDLREQTGLVYGVQSELSARRTRSVLIVSYACDPPNVASARGIIERDLRQMQTDPVTPAELLQARTLLIRQIPIEQASLEGIARQWLHLALQDLPLDEPLQAAKRYRAITAEQVMETFAKWVRPADFVQVNVGPKPE